MNKYESIIIMNTNITDEERKNVIEKITNLINSNGNMTKIEELGKKKLAYEIKNNTDGYYVLFEFETIGEQICELERIYRITEEIIKFIVIRKDED